MRRGTHSCLECRQRKVRCVIIPDVRKCQGCSTKDLRCTDQELRRSRSPDLERKSVAQERVRELEGVLDQVLSATAIVQGKTSRHVAEGVRVVNDGSPAIGKLAPIQYEKHRTKSPDICDITNPNSSSTDGWSSPKFGDQPLLRLFERADVSDKDNRNAPKNVLASLSGKQVIDEEAHPSLMALQQQIPNSRDLMLILRAGPSSFGLWTASFPDTLGLPGKLTVERLQNHIYRCLHSDCSASAAKVALCLVLHLQQLPSQFVSTKIGFQDRSENLQETFITAVESLLASDHGPARTLEGLECMLLQSDYYINVGNLRKVWLIVRRAISLAQLLGLHCRVDATMNPKQNARRSAIWSELWQRDRGFSLILGLPYATLESQLPSLFVGKDESDIQRIKLFLRDLGTVMGHIIDRDQDPSGKTYLTTLKIAEELEECQQKLSTQWWEFRPGPETPVNAISGMYAAKMRFYTVERLLHLPFLLKAFKDSKFNSSRQAALDSSREIISIYNVLRDEKRPALNMCDMADFQVFAAAMTLAVDRLASPRSSDDCDPNIEDRAWQIVSQTAAKLNQVTRSIVGCKVAMLGAQALDDFSKIRYAAGDQACKVDIPYFGKIEIQRPNALHDELAPQASSNAQTTNHGPIYQKSTDILGGPIESTVSFDSYLFPLSPASQLWQETNEDWTHMLDSTMADDWNWSPHGNDP